MTTTTSKPKLFSTLGQICKLIPVHLVPKLARATMARARRSVARGVKSGEIVVFDKAYVVFCHLYALHARGVIWVTRAKEKMRCRVMERRPVSGRVRRDEIVEMTLWKTHRDYPERLRRVVARVEVDGEEKEMAFLTNQFDWAASSVADLYRCRWQIEVFFKQIKQTLQLADFLGHNENAVRWQVWTALLLYVLLHVMTT